MTTVTHLYQRLSEHFTNIDETNLTACLLCMYFFVLYSLDNWGTARLGPRSPSIQTAISHSQVHLSSFPDKREYGHGALKTVKETKKKSHNNGTIYKTIAILVAKSILFACHLICTQNLIVSCTGGFVTDQKGNYREVWIAPIIKLLLKMRLN